MFILQTIISHRKYLFLGSLIKLSNLRLTPHRSLTETKKTWFFVVAKHESNIPENDVVVAVVWVVAKKN